MPTITGKQTDPSGARAATLTDVLFDLVDAAGDPVHNVYETATGRAIGSVARADLASDGSWTINVPGNAGLSNPDTIWRKRAIHKGERAGVAHLVVPLAGDATEDEIALPPATVPDPNPSVLLDSATVTGPTQVIGPAVPIGVATAITGTIVTVPDVDRPVLLSGSAMLSCSLADIQLVVGIGTPGTTNPAALLADASAANSTTVVQATCKPDLLLPAHSPGDYQLFATAVSLSSLTLTVQNTAIHPAQLRAIAL